MRVAGRFGWAGCWVMGTVLALMCALPAEATVVTGTFQYADAAGLVPIRNAVVEIWYKGPGVFDINWGSAGSVRTNSAGRFTFTDGRSAGTYSVRVYATNDAVIVYPVDLHFGAWYASPPDSGPMLVLGSNSVGSVLDFSASFTDEGVTRFFNVANAAQFAYEYAIARRDPAETDTIPQANVQPTSWGDPGTATYYSGSTNTIMIQQSRMFSDLAVLHEYAHVLQHHISSASSWVSVHDGCAMRLTPGGTLINSPEYAWTEAFAAYYVHAVRRAYAAEPSLDGFAATATGFIESPPACSVVGFGSSQAGTITPAMVENFIAAALWDLVDPVGNAAQGFEGHDTVAGEESTVFRIFDREIGNGPANIFTFRTAWNARGKSSTGLECILSAYGIVPAVTGCRPGALKLPGDYNNDRKTDIALTAVAGWGSIPVAFSNGDGSFHVTNSQSTTFASLASSRGVSKLTGDFDGDGDTDIALVGGPTLTGIQVAYSDGNGSFTVVDSSTTMFHTFAANPDNRRLVGDFDNDGASDIALIGAPGFNRVAIAFGRRGMQGVFTETVSDLSNMLGVKAAVARATIVAGEFTGDGRTDIAVLLPASLMIGLAASNGDGTFAVSDINGGEFGTWITLPNVKLLTGDFNADRVTDLALTGPSGWGSVPMLLSVNGTGSFTVVNAPVNLFAAWSASSGAIPLVGDFDGLGASDIALTGVVGWNTLPVAVSGGAGFDIKNPVVGNFAIWATTPNVKPIVGDFNADGKADVALTGAAGWGSVPVAFSGTPTPQWTPFWPPIEGGGGSTLQPLAPLSFTVTNYLITDFAGWSSIVQ